jgi:hypothetical protein
MMSGQMGADRRPDGPDGVPDGLDGVPDGPDEVPDRSHVIGQVIFECHVTRLAWQGVILLSTLLSQC